MPFHFSIRYRGLIHKLNKIWPLRRPFRSGSKLYAFAESKSISRPLEFHKGGWGSVLIPLLFLIYINDIADYLDGMAILFADDTSFSFSSNNLAFTKHVLNTNLV